jgi:hypothetical protein
MQPTVRAGEHELTAGIASTVCPQFIRKEGRQMDDTIKQPFLAVRPDQGEQGRY